MVLYISMVLLFLANGIFGKQETFIEEHAPQSKKSLPKARSEALDHLEVLGHDLTALISETAGLISDIFDAGIVVTEGTKKGFMESLNKDRACTLQKLEQSTHLIKDQLRTVQEIRRFIKPPQDKKGK